MAPDREVDSLQDAFDEDLFDELAPFPRVAEAVRDRKQIEITFSAQEMGQFNATMLMFLAKWVRSLAGEVDRLITELEEQSSTGDDLDS